MTKKPVEPPHLYRALDERLQNNDKEGAIELYLELLNSGHSVGEILNAAGPMRRKSEEENAATAEHPRSEPNQAVTDLLAEAAQTDARSTCGPNVSRDAERRGTEKLEATASAPLDEPRLDDRERLPRAILPGWAPADFSLAGAHASKSREATMDAGDQERFRSGTFASVAKRIAFGALYTVLVASASIVGFSVLRSGHDAEPAIAGVQLPISGGSGTEALGASGAAAGREAAAETAIPEKQVMSADASQALRLLPPGEPDSAGPEPAEPILVGVQEKAFAAQQEAEARPRTDVGQPDASEPSTVPAKAPGGSGHEPLTLETQSPSVTPAGPAKTAPHLDRPEAEQPKAEEMLQAAPAVPTRNVSAAVPAPTNAVRSRGARAPRGYAGSRSSISRRTAVKHPQPIYYYGQRTGSYYMDPARGYGYYYGQRTGSYYTDPARGYGYGYGGLVPHSDTGN